MRAVACLLALTLSACSTGAVVSDQSSSLAESPASSVSSSSSSINPKAPTIYLRWVEKKLPAIIKGQPRRKLSLQLSGAHRELVYVGTFNGEAFDLKGTFVTTDDALLKASIWWKGTGNEIWIERKDGKTLIARHRDINEKKPYLTVDKVIATINIEEGVQVTPAR